jgi:hypothetical protein
MYFQTNSSVEKGCAKARSLSCEQAKLMANGAIYWTNSEGRKQYFAYRKGN